MKTYEEPKRHKFCTLIVIVGLIGLLPILHGTPSYAQTQPALVDLNNASEKELESIKGVGPATAKKIIAGRPYKSVDDLLKAGIAAKTVEGMKPFVRVGPPAPPAAKTDATKPATQKPSTKEPVKEAPAKSVPSVSPSPASSTPAAQKPATPTAAAPKSSTRTPAQSTAKPTPGQKVNINTATKEQLEALPEVGPVKAQAIIDGRPYKTTEDVMKVKGIKEGTYGKIKDLITVN